MIIAVIDGANRAHMARIIEIVIVESNFKKSFLSSFDRKIIPDTGNSDNP